MRPEPFRSVSQEEIESDPENQHRIQRSVNTPNRIVRLSGERLGPQEVPGNEERENGIGAELDLRSDPNLGRPPDCGHAKRGAEHQKTAPEPQQRVRRVVGQERVLEQGGEGLRNRGFVDTIRRQQPKLVPKTQTDPVGPSVREADPDRPADVGDTSITRRAESIGGEGHDQASLGSHGDRPLPLRRPAWKLSRIGADRLRRSQAQDQETEGYGVGWHGRSIKRQITSRQD